MKKNAIIKPFYLCILIMIALVLRLSLELSGFNIQTSYVNSPENKAHLKTIRNMKTVDY